MGQLVVPCPICALFLPDLLDVSEQHCGADLATVVNGQKKPPVPDGAEGHIF